MFFRGATCAMGDMTEVTIIQQSQKRHNLICYLTRLTPKTTSTIYASYCLACLEEVVFIQRSLKSEVVSNMLNVKFHCLVLVLSATKVQMDTKTCIYGQFKNRLSKIYM